MIIGIDLDNTIIKYDKVFAKIAKKYKILSSEEILQSKKHIKSILLKKNKGMEKWKFLQGKVYGKYLLDANIMPYFKFFLKNSVKNNCKIFIISHKTKYGHYDKEKINLRKQAIEWFKKNNLFNGAYNLKKENIFFFDTKYKKIEKIKKLKIDWFIDDLESILNNKAFPLKTKKILFLNNEERVVYTDAYLKLVSWKDINNILFEKNEKQKLKIFLKYFLSNHLFNIKKIFDGVNSNTYKITSKKNYLLKAYPRKKLDDRKRLKTEFFSFKNLQSQHCTFIPKAYAMNSDLDIGLYEWINGYKIKNPKIKDINKMIKYVKFFNEISKNPLNRDFEQASEACLSASDLIFQINTRLKNLKKVKDNDLLDFLKSDVYWLWRKLKKKLTSDYPKKYLNSPIPYVKRILSPSDFGFHNSLKKKNKLYLFDFEYFGWDDPVKLTADFLIHPGMKLSLKNKRKWIEEMNNTFSHDKSFLKRFEASYYCYYIRWILIVLNSFITTNSHEKSNYAFKKSVLHEKKLIKAKLMYKNLKKEIIEQTSILDI